jgi:hypothetical protein
MVCALILAGAVQSQETEATNPVTNPAEKETAPEAGNASSAKTSLAAADMQSKGAEEGKEGAAGIPPSENGPVQEFSESDSQGGFYGAAEYLLWWFKKDRFFPLITHGDPNDTPTGALGQPGTSVLFGGNHVGADPFSGGRFTLGTWLGNEQAWGLEANFFFMEQRRSFFHAVGSGEPGTGSLNIAFFNGDANIPDSQQVALEGTSEGEVGTRLTQRLLGSEVNLRHPISDNDDFRLSVLAGFRFLDLQESFDLFAASALLPTTLGIGTLLEDSIATRNRFYGGQIGAAADFFRGDWRLNVNAKVALGGNDELVRINGTTTSTDPINGTVVAPGGILSGPNNIGDHHRGEFAVVPEVGVNVGYQITENVTVSLGYTFLYISDVVRPGEQIDHTVTFQTNNRPGVLFKNSDFWAQGINLGLQIRY